MNCKHCGTEMTSLFCTSCGKADKRELQSVRLVGFTGRFSMSPSVNRFFDSGDPDEIDRP